MIKPQTHIAAMAAYELADMGGGNLISLAQNESAFAASPAAIHAGTAALQATNQYSDPDWQELRIAIGQIHSIDPEMILCGAGSMELINSLIRCYAGPGDEVLCPAYGYLYVATATQISGANYRRVAEPEFAVSVDLLIDAVTDRTRIVFICNPGNPTGTRINNAEIVRLRDALPERVLLVVDQAYAEFDPQDHSSIFALTDRGNTVITRTFSKAYGLAGARVGWGAFPKEIAVEIRKLLNPNNISNVSQAMARAAVLDQKHMINVVDKTTALREHAGTMLRQSGYAVPDSHTNFILIPFVSSEAAGAADRMLREAGYLLRRMGGYGLPQCLRATIGEVSDMHTVTTLLTKTAGDFQDG